MSEENKRAMKVIEEKNGYKFGINENPDVAHLPEEDRYKLEYPNGEHVSGRKETIAKLFLKMSQ
jgi:hypothetical protein